MGSGVGAVLVETPVGLLFLNMAAGKFLVAVLLLGASDAKRTLRGNARPSVDNRDARSLVNTFPFNANSGNGHHGNHHDHHEEPARRAFTGLDSRNQRQGGDDTDVSFPAVAAARPGNDGKRCIDKVEMIEETEYDEVVQCDHSYDRRCHTTYVTQYESQQEEDCDENFRKSCFIEYEQIAFNETATVCRTPLVKDCDVRALRSAGPSTSPSAGPSRRCTTWRTTWSPARPRSKRSARTTPAATPPTPSAPCGP